MISRDVVVRAAERAFLLVIPAVATALLVVGFLDSGVLGYDFRYGAWPAGDHVLHGLSPYVPGHWFRPDPAVGFAYPAPAALLFAVVALVPRDVAEAIAVTLALAAPLVALRLLGVVDWRPYGLVFLWPAVIAGWQDTNLSLFLVPGVAAIWAWRDRPRAPGLVLGLMVSLKLYLWPLGVFLLATRRYSAVAWGVAAAVALNLVAWLVLGFDELPRYRATLGRFSDAHEAEGLSPIGLVERSGGGRVVAYTVVIALTAAVCALGVVAARRGQQERCFVLTTAAVLLATPVAWLHYLALLVVPLALCRPRLGPLWALPLALWFCSRSVTPATWQADASIAVTTIFFVAILRPVDFGTTARRAAS